MTTSGTASFNLNLNELVEEAFERCGHELRTGYDLRTARRSLNLLAADWANRGINLWTLEQGIIDLTEGRGVYPLPVDTVDLLDHVVRNGAGQNQTDINISRISESTFLTIPNKNAQGRPIQVWINRQNGQTSATTITLNGAISNAVTTITLSTVQGLSTEGFIQLDSETIQYNGVDTETNQILECIRGVNGTTAASHLNNTKVYVQWLPTINIWPKPNVNDTYSFVYYRLRRIQDAGTGVTTEDIPFRFIPAMVAGLAYYLSLKLPGAEMRVEMLKAMYDEAFQLAADEDREKASVRFVPRSSFYYM